MTKISLPTAVDRAVAALVPARHQPGGGSSWTGTGPRQGAPGRLVDTHVSDRRHPPVIRGGRDRGSVVLTEQASERILVLPADRTSWQHRKPSWAWAPNAANGLAEPMGSWSNPSDAKLAERTGRSIC
ncbi:hypothetical protein P3102_21115 [Amycolatopsis sp. QT-25]|uniref:hypothetical protein n=1 Tax=Amycolatopsis sp. QT-25 TaxID=3034022 RepID=UPI0023ECC6BE|nr:hypothetical protein [Amycolatopsis sp. QT-25]WET76619.1 hypothetical protein P3102_21115 [Amycolatopsis sp. QT-25]